MNCLPTAGPRDHTVRFYRAEEELAATVGSYLADRSRAGLDHGRFRSVVSELIRRAAASGRRVRSYGEMVASRWNRGHADVIATRSFPAELDSVRAARHVTAGLLDGETAQEVAELVAIVVTELASNAVLHASSGFTLTISRSQRRDAARLRVGRRRAAERQGCLGGAGRGLSGRRLALWQQGELLFQG
jgi:hypothetical protein